MMTIEPGKAAAWAFEEFGHAELGDIRRTRRLVKMATSVLEHPAGTVAAVFDNPADLCGAYDFLENDAVDPVALAKAMAVATTRRAQPYPFVWVATDGTSVTVTDRTQSKETGRLGTTQYKARGDKIHSALVIDPEGIPIGLAGFSQWQRGPKLTKATRKKRPTKEKETQRWLDVRESVRDVFRDHAGQVVLHFLHDREADAWPVILDAFEHREGERTTIRAQWDRRLLVQDASEDAATRKLRQALSASEVLGTMELEVLQGPHRPARTATLEIRACPVTLDLRDPQTNQRHAAQVYVVCAHEVSPVPSGQKPLEWLLLTTYPVQTFEDACHVVQGYAWRWRIEQFHVAWKSAGTDIEATQLEAADHRARWSLILAAVAVALLRWQWLARLHPETPAEQEFTAEQLEAIRDLQKDEVVPEHGPVTLWQVIVAIAYLGGWAGSKKRPPGTKILARGWAKVTAHMQGMRRRNARLRRQNSLDGYLIKGS